MVMLAAIRGDMFLVCVSGFVERGGKRNEVCGHFLFFKLNNNN